jgi:hypothetical protein
MNQGNLLAKLIKGGILLDSGKYEDGFDELRVAEEQFADHPAPSYLLYWGYTKSGKSELARAAFNRFVAKEGDEEEMKQYMHDWGFTF